jgi:hypothetical protein
MFGLEHVDFRRCKKKKEKEIRENKSRYYKYGV